MRGTSAGEHGSTLVARVLIAISGTEQETMPGLAIQT